MYGFYFLSYKTTSNHSSLAQFLCTSKGNAKDQRDKRIKIKGGVEQLKRYRLGWRRLLKAKRLTDILFFSLYNKDFFWTLKIKKIV